MRSILGSLFIILILTACGKIPGQVALPVAITQPSGSDFPLVSPIPALKSGCPRILIGKLTASSDENAVEEQQLGYCVALREINQAGGVQGCLVDDLVDTQKGKDLFPDSPQILLPKLADQNVLAIVGGASNNDTKRAAALANYFQIPFLVATDTGDDITETGTQWLFRVPPPSKNYATAAFDVVKGTAHTSVAIVYELTEYGESAATEAGKVVLNLDLTLAAYYGYSPKLVDYNDILESLNGASVVYVISSDPSQALMLVDKLKHPPTPADPDQQPANISMIIGNGFGFTSNSFLYDEKTSEVRKELENIFITVPWNLDRSQSADQQFMDNMQYCQAGNAKQIQPVSQTVEAYTALKIAVAAIDKWAESTPEWRSMLNDPANIVSVHDALAKKLHSPEENYWDSMIGQIQFGTGEQVIQNALVVQVTDGKLVTVYGGNLAVSGPTVVPGY